MNAKKPKTKLKTIFSLRVMLALKANNVSPLFETDNYSKPGFKCWVYEETAAFKATLEDILGGK